MMKVATIQSRTGCRNDRLFICGIIVPAMIYFSVFVFYPFLTNFLYMFCKYNYISAPKWVGMRNIVHFFEDSVVHQAFMNTFIITLISVPLMLVLAVLTANALFNMRWGKQFFRSAIFSTYLTSLIVAAIVFKSFFGSELGFVNGVVRQLHLMPIPWLSQPGTAMLVVILLSVWKYLGYYVVVLLAGFSNVDGALFEAGKIDGASGAQIFRYITLPQLKPTLVYSSIIASISFLRTYSTVLVLTKGGPYSSTQTVLMYMFDQGFQSLNVGYASVIAVALFLIILALTLVQSRVSSLLAD